MNLNSFIVLHIKVMTILSRPHRTHTTTATTQPTPTAPREAISTVPMCENTSRQKALKATAKAIPVAARANLIRGLSKFPPLGRIAGAMAKADLFCLSLSLLVHPGAEFFAGECVVASILLRRLRQSGFAVVGVPSRIRPKQGEKCRSGETSGGFKRSSCSSHFARKPAGRPGERSSVNGDIMTVGERAFIRRIVGFGR